jgi:hypothetical protein
MISYFPVVTGSLTVSGSVNISGGITASGGITISGSIASASFASTASFVALAQSASNAVSAATASFANTLTVAGNLTAQTLVVQTITSSVDFVTGSTRFGSIAANTHTFTGSVNVSGSISSDLIDGGVIFTKTAGNSVGLFTNTFQISGSGTKNDLNAYVYGGESFGVWTNAIKRLTITGGGNVGIGTTPSAWGTSFTKSAIQFGGSVGVGVLWTNSFNNGVFLGNNLYDDGAGNARYIVNGTSTQYVQSGGEHYWSNASSGTAGNVATFTEKMRITSGGVLKIGNSGTADDGSNPGYKNVAIAFNNSQNRGEIQAVQQGILVYPLILNGAGGNVGIGTYGPATKLHVSGPVGYGTSTYPQSVKFVKTGTNSVAFTVTVPYSNNWAPASATVRVAGSRTGLEEQYAGLYLLRLTYYGGAGVTLASYFINGSDAVTFSMSSNTSNPQVFTLTINDGGATTDYLIADLDLSVNGGIISIA